MDTEIAIISLTKNGLNSAMKIKSLYPNSVIYAPEKLRDTIDNKVNYYKIEFKDQVEKLFKNYNAILFIMATGIVVRTISKLLEDKSKDPAILVADEKLTNIISLLSGHVGGANHICRHLAYLCQSNPVITTATDVNSVGALDIIAKEINAYDNSQKKLYKDINYKLASGEKAVLISDIDLSENLDLRGFVLADINKIEKYKGEEIIHITIREKTGYENLKNYHKIIPKLVGLGIGCKKNTSYDLICETVKKALGKLNISIKSVQKIGSIDLKRNEPGIIKLSKVLGVDFVTYTVEDIKKCEIYEKIDGSSFVEKTVGVKSVASPCSYLAVKGQLILDKFINNGVTISISLKSGCK